MSTFVIEEMARLTSPQPRGFFREVVLARFSYSYGPVAVFRALLTQDLEAGEIHIRSQQRDRDGTRFAVRGKEHRAALRQAAISMYRSLGGEIAETPLATASVVSELNDSHSPTS